MGIKYKYMWAYDTIRKRTEETKLRRQREAAEDGAYSDAMLKVHMVRKQVTCLMDVHKQHIWYPYVEEEWTPSHDAHIRMIVAQLTKEEEGENHD